MEPLSDPLNDRAIPSVPAPPHRPLSIDIMIKPYSRIPSWIMIKDHLSSGGFLSRSSAIYLITQAKYLFEKERTILETTDEITVVGDIHGQFYDLLYILEHSESVAKRKILFLGDYVDRGRYSIEVVFLLFALKINFPYSVLMIRGNHETRDMTSHYSFRNEVLNKYGIDIYDLLMETFDAMPLACIINNEYFAVHGGISPSIKVLEDIVYTNRFREPGDKGVLCDLLWSDPTPDNISVNDFSKNSSRGCGCYFGKSATKTFLNKNHFKGIIRAHEVQNSGYKYIPLTKSLSLITVFSAANYCGTVGNKGAFLTIVNSKIDFHVFDVNPQPFELPNSDNLFAWSVPFVIQKVLSMFNEILKSSNEDSTTDGYLNEELMKQFASECLEPNFNLKEIKEAVKKHEKQRKSEKALEIDTCPSDGSNQRPCATARSHRNLHKFQKLSPKASQSLSKTPKGLKKYVFHLAPNDVDKISTKLEKFLRIKIENPKIESFPNSPKSFEKSILR